MAKRTYAEMASQDQRGTLESIDRVLESAVESGQTLSFENRLMMSTQCGWVDKEINRQLARMQRVQRAKSVAGTSAQRESLEGSIVSAKQRLNQDGPKLEKQIEALQGQLNGLKHDIDSQVKRHQQVEDSVKVLRDSVPHFIQREIDARKRSVNQATRRRVLDLETEKHHRECLLDPSRYANHHAYIDMVRISYPKMVINQVDGAHVRYALGPEWPDHCDAMRLELGAIDKELSSLRPKLDAELAACESLRDYYLS